MGLKVEHFSGGNLPVALRSALICVPYCVLSNGIKTRSPSQNNVDTEMANNFQYDALVLPINSSLNLTKDYFTTINWVVNKN